MPRTASRSNSILHRVPQVFPRLALLSMVLFGATDPAGAGDPAAIERAVERITIADLKRHCGTLASDSLEGREAGSTGGRAAAAYLQTELKKISGIEPAGTSGWTQEFGANFRNVLAVLPGSDSVLRQEIIVIGAHYDHVGRGNQTNSNGPFGQIHNGADDNASGTSALLELADAFASMSPAPARSILFAFWDAEEAGLLGSQHWVTHPTRPIRDVRLDINIDMLGRLREGQVTVVGWRSAAGMRSRMASFNSRGDFTFLFQPTVIAESDFYPFYRAGIPCLHLDTGKHNDYHRPTDDADKLNYEGIRSLAEFVFRLVQDAASQTEPLASFRREALTEATPAWLTPRVASAGSRRLGVVFDAEQFRQNRAIVSGVSAGSAADKAGLRPGDQLLKVAHWEKGDVADLPTIVQIAKNPVFIRVKRPGREQEVDLEASLNGNPVRVGIGWQMDGALPGTAAITEVVPDSPAHRAGIKAGDVVESLGENRVTSEDEFRRRLLDSPGPLHLRIERSGRPMNVTVNLFEPKPVDP
jgi:Peptidase family M28/PDZ domain